MRLRGAAGWVLAGCFLAMSSWAQAPADPSPGGPDDPASASTPGDGGTADDGSAGGAPGEPGDEPTDAAVPERNVLSEFQRMLRTNQSHLTEDGSPGFGLVPIVIMLLFAYVVIVLLVLAWWRRARDPKFWRLRTDPVQGEGRWLIHLAYAIRRKVDAEVTLQMAKVDPPGCGAQLAYLVDDEIKGRVGEGGEATLTFKGLNPKNFWQKNQQESLAIGFELIQPRDRKITLHLDIRTDYAIGKKKGLAGLFQELLVFEPATTGQPLEVLEDDSTLGLSSASPVGGELTGGLGALGGLDDTGGFGGGPGLVGPGMVAPPLSASGGASGPHVDELRGQQREFEQRLELLEGRFLNEGQDTDALERRLQNLEIKLEAMPTPSSGPSQELEQRLMHLESQAMSGGTVTVDDIKALRQDLRASEERAAKALRDNLQVVVKNMKGLRGELTQLNAAVNDMMQRFVNSERRMADIAKRLPPES